MRPALLSAALAALALPSFDEAPKPPRIGAAVAPFRLNDHEGRVRSFGPEWEGWTVFAFYPKARTPG